VIAALRWHADSLPEGSMARSELLFPSEKGGASARRRCSTSAFQRTAKALGLKRSRRLGSLAGIREALSALSKTG